MDTVEEEREMAEKAKLELISWGDIGASEELSENGKYGRVSEAGLINLALVDLADNVHSEFSSHVVTVPKLRGKKIARMIQCAAHDP